MARNRFFAYLTWARYASHLTNEERLAFYDAIFHYVEHGTTPELSGRAEGLFYAVQQNIDHDTRLYENAVERGQQNGKKGGRPKKKTQEPKSVSENQQKGKKPTSVEKTDIGQQKPDMNRTDTIRIDTNRLEPNPTNVVLVDTNSNVNPTNVVLTLSKVNPTNVVLTPDKKNKSLLT